MTWKSRPAPQPVEQIHPDAQVYQDHLRILREINAPEKLIKIAERVAAQNAAKK